jgi:hypothetical protein
MSVLAPTGNLTYEVKRAQGPGLAWKLRNTTRPAFMRGWLAYHTAPVLGKVLGFGTITSKFSFKVRKADGTWIDYGTADYRVVTTAFVTALALALGTQASPGNFFYHALGTSTAAASADDTALGTELTTEYTGNVRATGTHTESAGVYTTVATNTLDSGTPAVTEHGVLTQAATGGGTLLDRHVFAAVNMASGDSFVSTYELTLTAGG